MMHTADLDSTVCISPLSQDLLCASHCEVKLRGVHHTAESSDQNFSKSSAVCIPPQSRAPRCACHHGVKLCGVHPTAESSSAVCITHLSQTAHRGVKSKSLLVSGCFKGTIRRNPFRGERIYNERK